MTILIFLSTITLPWLVAFITCYSESLGFYLRKPVDFYFKFLQKKMIHLVPKLLSQILNSTFVIGWFSGALAWMHIFVQDVISTIPEGLVAPHQRHFIEHVFPAFLVGSVAFICSTIAVVALNDYWDLYSIFFPESSEQKSEAILNILLGSTMQPSTADLLAFEKMDLESSQPTPLIDSAEKSNSNIEEKVPKTWPLWVVGTVGLVFFAVVGVSYYAFYK